MKWKKPMDYEYLLAADPEIPAVPSEHFRDLHPRGRRTMI